MNHFCRWALQCPPYERASEAGRNRAKVVIEPTSAFRNDLCVVRPDLRFQLTERRLARRLPRVHAALRHLPCVVWHICPPADEYLSLTSMMPTPGHIRRSMDSPVGLVSLVSELLRSCNSDHVKRLQHLVLVDTIGPA